MQSYSKEFRDEAISLSDEIGVKKTAMQLGMNYATLMDWRKKRKRMAERRRSDGAAKTVEEREVSKLKKANAILKDALGFFVLDRKRQGSRASLRTSFTRRRTDTASVL